MAVAIRTRLKVHGRQRRLIVRTLEGITQLGNEQLKYQAKSILTAAQVTSLLNPLAEALNTQNVVTEDAWHFAG